MKKHTEESAVRYLLRKGAKEYTDKDTGILTISISQRCKVGIRTLGVIDFLRKYCGREVEVVK